MNETIVACVGIISAAGLLGFLMYIGYKIRIKEIEHDIAMKKHGRKKGLGLGDYYYEEKTTAKFK